MGARFSAPVQSGAGAHLASCTMGTESFPRVKLPGCGVDHQPPSSAEVEGRVELYICSPSGPSWPVIGWNWLYFYNWGFQNAHSTQPDYIHSTATDFFFILTGIILKRSHGILGSIATCLRVRQMTKGNCISEKCKKFLASPLGFLPGWYRKSRLLWWSGRNMQPTARLYLVLKVTIRRFSSALPLTFAWLFT